MVTLTYAKVEDWSAADIKACLNQVRTHYARKSIKVRYAWVAELQQRGAVHYHVLFWFPRHIRVPKFDSKGWWPHGFTNRKEVYAPVKYAIKYTSKGSDDVASFPAGARIFGVGGLDGRQHNERMWWAQPKYVRDIAGIDVQPRRRVGGGFICRATGEVIPSQFVVAGIGGGKIFIRLRSEVFQ